MTTATAIEPGKIDIARVIQQTFAVLGRNFVTFVVLALLLSGVPTAIIGYLQADNLAAAQGGNFNFGPGYFTTVAVGGLAALVTSAILQGALIYGTVQDMNGARPSVADSLATGLRAFLPLIGVSILFALAVALGFVLLVVPGLMIICAWCVAVPALVADRAGVLGSFRRSADLTRGNRWRIFGLLVIVWIIAVVISAVVGAVTTGASFASGADPVALLRSPVQIVGNLIINTLTAVITSTGVAVLYVELRRAREGLGSHALADIFS
jgi:MFS family permease